MYLVGGVAALVGLAGTLIDIAQTMIPGWKGRGIEPGASRSGPSPPMPSAGVCLALSTTQGSEACSIAVAVRGCWQGSQGRCTEGGDGDQGALRSATAQLKAVRPPLNWFVADQVLLTTGRACRSINSP